MPYQVKKRYYIIKVSKLHFFLKGKFDRGCCRRVARYDFRRDSQITVGNGRQRFRAEFLSLRIKKRPGAPGSARDKGESAFLSIVTGGSHRDDARQIHTVFTIPIHERPYLTIVTGYPVISPYPYLSEDGLQPKLSIYVEKAFHA